MISLWNWRGTSERKDTSIRRKRNKGERYSRVPRLLDTDSHKETTTNLQSGGGVYLTEQTQTGRGRRKCNSAILGCRWQSATAGR